MGYSISYDVSCKVQRAAVRGYLSHAARDVDRKNGVEVRHSNEDINPARTCENVTKVYDAAIGKYKDCQSSDELIEALELRLGSVKKKLRKDAVVLRPVLLQLDPEWYRDTKDEQEKRKSYNKMIGWAVKKYGKENVIGYSLHLDETNPHLHIFVTPVIADGRLSQKDWYNGPAALRQMHEDLREHMRDAGFDVDLKRKKPGKYAKRMTEEEYKDFAELQTQREEIEKRAEEIEASAAGARMLNSVVMRKEKAVEQREKDLEAREAAIEAKERALIGKIKKWTGCELMP